MSLQLFVLCATLAIASAGYLQPALRYAHAAPIAISAPTALTYNIPPTVRAEHLPPVVTSSYGYSTAHTPVPAPIIRAEPVHFAPAIHPAPVALAAPAFHAARVALPAPAPLAFAAPAIHHAPAPLAFAAPAIHAAPAPLAFAGHAAPLGLGFGGSHLAFGRNYATGFGFGAPAIHSAPLAGAGFGFGGHFARSIAAPAPLGFSGHLGATPLGFGHTSYGSHF